MQQSVTETRTSNAPVWPDHYSILASVAEGTDSAVFVLDFERHILWRNHAAADLLHPLPALLPGERLDSILTEAGAAALFREEAAIREGRSPVSFEIGEERLFGRALTPGAPRVFLGIQYPFRDFADGFPGGVQGMVCILRDVTANRRQIAETDRLRDELESFDRRFSTIVEDLNEGILLTDLDDRILFANSRMTTMTGYTPEEMVGQFAYKLLLPPEEWPDMHTRNRRRARNESESYEVVLLRRDGGTFWAQINAAPYRDRDGSVIGTVGAITDISERKQAEARVQWQAFHDPLTGLPNRILFLERLEPALKRARHGNYLAAVLFLDLDRFKNVNDTLGHDIGDELLRGVAARLVSALPDDVTIARLGGDEFTLLVPEAQTPQDAAAIASRSLFALQAPFTVRGQEFYLSASIGLSLFPYDGTDAMTLLKRADSAMYQAKAEGTGYQRYGTRGDTDGDGALMLETSLRKALEQEQFLLLYQPQMDLRTGQLRGFEALVRWQHPERGVVEPGRFIALAEATGLINPIGDWVLRTACRQAAEWRMRYRLPVSVGVNLSARQFRRRGLAEMVSETLRETGLSPWLLDIELTETVLLEDSEAAVENLRALKRLGANLAVDDFGTGYSSLAYLRRFPLDVLKIDQAFIRELAENATDQAIVRALMDMAHALGLQVIAEGVETTEQRDMLAALGCDLIQGYLISPPLTAADALGFARDALYRPRGFPSLVSGGRAA
jgi:diguanylate cyclase (GGDEF)-like protein/PAS domain S-box-containing protein